MWRELGVSTGGTISEDSVLHVRPPRPDQLCAWNLIVAQRRSTEAEREFESLRIDDEWRISETSCQLSNRSSERLKSCERQTNRVRFRVAGLSVVAEGMLGDVGSKEHGMEGHRWSCSGEWRSSPVARLQRPFELVPREVLPDGQLWSCSITQFSPHHVAHLSHDGLLLLTEIVLVVFRNLFVQVLMDLQHLHGVHHCLRLLDAGQVSCGRRGLAGWQTAWTHVHGFLALRQWGQLGLWVVQSHSLPQGTKVTWVTLLGTNGHNTNKHQKKKQKTEKSPKWNNRKGRNKTDIRL